MKNESDKQAPEQWSKQAQPGGTLRYPGDGDQLTPGTVGHLKAKQNTRVILRQSIDVDVNAGQFHLPDHTNP